MKRLILLNSIADADNCIEKELHINSYILSTHASVNIYLKEMCNVDSECISSFFSDAEILEYRDILSKKVDEILSALDINIAPLLNKQFDLKMRYFWPLYSYYGKHQITAQYFLIEGLKRSIDNYNAKKIILCNHKLNYFMDGVSDVASIASVFLPDIETEILSCPQNYEANGSFSNKISHWSNIIVHRPVFTINKIVELISANLRFRLFSKNGRTVLLHGALYDFNFFYKELKGYDVLYYPNSIARKPFGFGDKKDYFDVDIDFQGFNFMEGKRDSLVDTFLGDIQADFKKNIGGHLSEIFRLQSIAERHPIRLGIWGNPPVSGTKALIFEYLLSEGVTVLGGQHGCLYGEAVIPWHFDSDFNRCDYYVSYGFTQGDLSRTYPDRSPRCTILPFGAQTPVCSSKRKKIDILFPITNSVSILEGGILRISPEKLAKRQVELLEYLNTLSDCRVIVKPFLFSTFDRCGPLMVIKRLKNLEVMSKITLIEFLQRYSPRGVLIEYPSQPLLECLHLDTEIFLMNNPMGPYEERALGLLRKRVHYAENVDEIVKKINLFLEGKLERRRDDSFYKQYVHKENRKKLILRQIDELVQSPS